MPLISSFFELQEFNLKRLRHRHPLNAVITQRALASSKIKLQNEKKRKKRESIYCDIFCYRILSEIIFMPEHA